MFRNLRTAGALLISGICVLNICASAALADNARKLTIHRVLCDIYDKNRDNKAEMGEYIVLNQMAPNDPQIQYGFGIFLARQKEHQLAITHLKKATQLDGSVSDYWVQLGNEYLQIRNYQGAADAFHSAGAKYFPQESAARQYIQQIQQINAYNKKVKEQEE